MEKALLLKSIRESVRFVFARSSGPGGQNVNKLNTKVQAFVRLPDLLGLTETESLQLRKKLAGSINQTDETYTSVQEERLQEHNKRIALAKLEQKIIEAARILPKRKKTRPSKAAQEKRLKSKAILSNLKKMRAGYF